MSETLAKVRIPVPGGHLAAFSEGHGPAVIFLHGGPGDSHHYMKRMARPLLREFRCIFFDQRGTGGSNDFAREPATFRLDLLFEDLRAVQNHFKIERPLLVGHSWGAMYALFACIQDPERFRKAALLSMGPLDTEMEGVVAAHLTSVLNDDEKVQWNKRRAERNLARDEKRFDRVAALDREMMRLRVKAWIFNPAFREPFLNDFFRDPPTDREVNKWIWTSQRNWFSWDLPRRVRTPLWICTGANDSVPIDQTDRIMHLTPSTERTLFERCGHLPWIEHPEAFYEHLVRFLKSPAASGC